MIKEKEVLREVQLCNLKNLKKLDEICRKYNLRYWIAYGSLIGTVRHKGFIPWDDDIDVQMMREDYLKLCKCGGSLSYLETLKHANVSNPFEAGSVKKSTAYALEILSEAVKNN